MSVILLKKMLWVQCSYVDEIAILVTATSMLVTDTGDKLCRGLNKDFEDRFEVTDFVTNCSHANKYSMLEFTNISDIISATNICKLSTTSKNTAQNFCQNFCYLLKSSISIRINFHYFSVPLPLKLHIAHIRLLE